MSVFTTHGFVLRAFPHKEADLVVRLFTEEFGKMAGVAKGARRPKSPMSGRFEILQLVEIKGYRSAHRELCSIDSASPLESFTSLRGSLEGFYRIHYVAELLDLAFAEEGPHVEFFALVARLLTLLEHDAVDPEMALRFLELRLLEELGYGLSFGVCASCHESNAPIVGFDPGEGGFVCETCLRALPEALRIGEQVVERLARLWSASLTDLDSEVLPRALRRPLRQVGQRMLMYRLERPLRSARYLEEVEQDA